MFLLLCLVGKFSVLQWDSWGLEDDLLVLAVLSSCTASYIWQKPKLSGGSTAIFAHVLRVV